MGYFITTLHDEWNMGDIITTLHDEWNRKDFIARYFASIIVYYY